MNSFDLNQTIELWGNATSTWVSDFYNVKSYGGTTETGEVVAVLKLSTEVVFWYFDESAYSMNNETQRMLESFELQECHTTEHRRDLYSTEYMSRSEQQTSESSLDTLHIYYTHQLRYQMENAEESIIFPRDIVTFPFGGRVYREDFLNGYLRGSNHSAFQSVSSMTTVLIRRPPKVTKMPSASPTEQPSTTPSISPSFTLMEAEDTWAEIRVTFCTFLSFVYSQLHTHFAIVGHRCLLCIYLMLALTAGIDSIKCIT